MLYESMSWIASQIPGIILGALGLFATGYVNEFFAKRAESRKNRKELFETFGGILIKAEDDMWKSVSISEKDFIKYCRQLSLYNPRLADQILLNYYILWCGVSSDWFKPYDKWTKEEKDMHGGSIQDLRAMNVEFLNYAYPDRTALRHLKHILWSTKFKIRYLLKKKTPKMKKALKLHRELVELVDKMSSNPF